MSSLTDIEKRYLEKLLDMGGGYVLDFTDATFGEKKFSHSLRDFRNYVHPYEQVVSSFTPDEHTAKVCFQALKAAPASLAGERP